MQAGSVISSDYIGLAVLLDKKELQDLAANHPINIPLEELGVEVRGKVRVMCATAEMRKALRTMSVTPGDATLIYIVSLKGLRIITNRPKQLRLTTSNRLQGKQVVLRVACADHTDLDALLRKGEQDANTVSQGRGNDQDW